MPHADISSALLKRRYQRIAFEVIRDGLSFFFGIPKFLENNQNLDRAREYFVAIKLKNGEEITDKILSDIEAKIHARIDDLKEDLENCRLLLTEDNIWLQLLNTKPEQMQKYINGLTEDEIDELAIIPRWNISDYLLRRPYINDNFVLIDENQRTDSPD